MKAVSVDTALDKLSADILRRGGIYVLHEEEARLCNEQINKEFFSAYLYLQFSCYYTDEG